MPGRDMIPKNQLLAALPADEFERISPYLKYQSYPLGHILYEPGEEMKEVYFPEQALLSLLSLLEDGTLTEIALVGNEGMVGLPVIWGGRSTPQLLTVQFAGDVLVLEADQLVEEFNRDGTLRQLLLLFMQALFTQVAQNATCNRQHTIEERLARWLLSVQDSVQQDSLTLTHDFIAKMLGIRRSGVTVAAGVLQQAGMIRYSRGRIAILDRARLETASCECYRLVQQEYNRLLGSRMTRT